MYRFDSFKSFQYRENCSRLEQRNDKNFNQHITVFIFQANFMFWIKTVDQRNKTIYSITEIQLQLHSKNEERQTINDAKSSYGFWLVLWCSTSLSSFGQLYRGGGGNQNNWNKPPTCHNGFWHRELKKYLTFKILSSTDMIFIPLHRSLFKNFYILYKFQSF